MKIVLLMLSLAIAGCDAKVHYSSAEAANNACRAIGAAGAETLSEYAYTMANGGRRDAYRVEATCSGGQYIDVRANQYGGV